MMNRRIALFCLLTVIGWTLAACSQPETREPIAPTMIEDEEGPEPDWKIQRASYEAVIKGGLPKVFRWYFVAPSYKGAKFMGFQIVDIYKEELLKGPLKIGDVLLTINGAAVERPEHAQAIWRGLWGRKSLELVIIRDKKKKTYDIPVVQ
jgi:hypothetical protein